MTEDDKDKELLDRTNKQLETENYINEHTKNALEDQRDYLTRKIKSRHDIDDSDIEYIDED